MSIELEILFAAVIFVFVIFILIIKCILNDNRTNEINNQRNDRIDNMREEYRERMIEMASRQISLEDTTYEVDKELIKSLQKKYKIGISYSRYLKSNRLKINNDDPIQDESNKCIICLDEYLDNDNLSVMKCQHVFHHNCLRKWLNEIPNCPICRTDIIININ